MNYASHEELARIVGEKAKVPELDAFVAGAVLPDYVDDLLIKLPGSKEWKNGALGYRFSPFRHFCKPIGMEKYQGYCMDRDPSWPKGLKLPLGQLKAWPSRWCDQLGMQSLGPDPDPMESIIKVSTGNAPQHITYCTSAVYAEWIGKQICRPAVRANPKVFWKGVGAIAHIAMDKAVWHHTHICLLDGHQSYEGKIQEYGLKNRKWLEGLSLPAITGPFNIRHQIELMAETCGARKSPPPCDWALRKGFEGTYVVIVWANTI